MLRRRRVKARLTKKRSPQKRRSTRKRAPARRGRRILNRRRKLTVYLAWDRRAGASVVVKRYARRWEAAREWRVLRRVGNHTHFVRPRRYFVRKGKAYIVMERIRGQTLARAVARRGPFEPGRVIAIALEVLKGIDHLHRLGYVHGDLHSRNVFVTDLEAPAVKLIDFQHAVRKGPDGLARARRRLARPPASLAPESRRRFIDDSYDLYGVGYMCAYMLMGRPPSLRRVRRKAREGGELWRVIGRSVHPNPKKRFRSAREMADALLCAGGGILASEGRGG